MTPEKQRMAIAKVCGWTDINSDLFGYDRLFDSRCVIPDYLNDLNAMHEAEKTLAGTNKTNYESELCVICNGWRGAIHATAEQRAEALLKTLNLWTEE